MSILTDFPHVVEVLMRHNVDLQGHKGTTLEMKETPDVTETHSADYCTRCGGVFGGGSYKNCFHLIQKK